MSFLEKYLSARQGKESLLCVGLDPAVKSQRRNNTIEGDMLGFCENIVDNVADSCLAIKVNSQYVLFNLTAGELSKLNKKIHSKGMISILDHKLSDIGASNESALWWTSECGFDALTASPYPGNISETIESAHQKDLGVFVLTLMSNPQAKWIQRHARVNDVPVYRRVAEISAQNKADGVVVGATEEVSEREVSEIRGEVGGDCVILFPGVGAQGGDLKKIISSGGRNILVNVSRDVIYDATPSAKARKYREEIASLAKKLQGVVD
ncbi:MAG: orotidine-5'-phosphate decarboxylase [Candidatus Altiarchaeales archaeon]|nr:orotidine-5'-phosphate decarboxylase [Candidatus Altiarchaeales archaeon]